MKSTYTIQLSPKEQEQVEHERYYATKPKIRQRMEILWLQHLGHTITTTAQIAHCAPNTVRTVLDLYIEGGLERIRKYDTNQPQRTLAPYAETIRNALDEHPVATLSEARARIRELTNLELDEDTIGKFLRKLGFSRKKTGQMPAKADTAVQEEFKKNGSSHASRRPKKASDRCSSSMPPTSSSGYLWVLSGAEHEGSFPPMQAANASTSSERWT